MGHDAEIEAGIRSAVCTCGWEMVYIVPEESEFAMMCVLMHMRKMHLGAKPEGYIKIVRH